MTIEEAKQILLKPFNPYDKDLRAMRTTLLYLLSSADNKKVSKKKGKKKKDE